eukprot:8032438-Alexandrium_andersonii.AAC.1
MATRGWARGSTWHRASRSPWPFTGLIPGDGSGARADVREAGELFTLACDWAAARRPGVAQTAAPAWTWIR